MRVLTFGVPLVLLASLSSSAAAQPSSPGEWRLYEENDFFNPFTEQTDHYYTQGLRLEWLRSSKKSDRNFLPGISNVAWCKLLCGRGYTTGVVNTGYAVGQNMYTPTNITISRPQPYDRPWGGLLYASRSAVATYVEPSLQAQRQDLIEFTLGMVGPASLAKQVQIGWHHLIGAHRPEGWANQLRNEPVLQLRYDAALRWPETDGGHVDITPRLRGNLGNALTSLEADVTGRIGWNLSGFGRPIIPSTLVKGRPESTGSLFVRAGVKAVAHNIFLDGNTFIRNDIRIERKVLVPEFAAGAELAPLGNFSLTFQFVHRGSEFRSRGRNAPAQEFGAITLALVRQ